MLTVRGERKFEKEEKEENFHRIERRYGSFYRSFTIPNTVNPEGVKANYEAGVLRIELEKQRRGQAEADQGRGGRPQLDARARRQLKAAEDRLADKAVS